MTEETITISLKEYEDLKANKQRLESLTEDLNKACGWGNENWLHASLHIGNFIGNLKADIKGLKNRFENAMSLEETKKRPRYLVASYIKNGKIQKNIDWVLK